MRLGSYILKKLEIEYGSVKTPLLYNNVFELLIAVILSAQTNDNQVNKVTPGLFKRFNSIESLSNAKLTDIEQEISSINYYKSKARNIQKCAKRILNDFNGNVPNDMTELITLAGVGRKTANVILNEYFKNYSGIVVDTHVKRLSNRLGLSNENDVLKIEHDLMNSFNKDDWEKISLLLIYHGRQICIAKNPNCLGCVLNKKCPSSTIN